ncbi:putative adp-ribosylglycohydrolase [Fasciola gigantica]|uniref:Putative adp-ribosylglycohydrolase n=1 Tax=Fasciola gigantica TaxID=46835 RepID=A0A504YWX1_FASGI|nr:putative adp-ribosylglycohydrolase [Fasciola gigantica]
MKADKFCRGTILGALVGDCYGFVYEDKPTVQPDVPIALLRATISAALAALRSLRRERGFNPEDMAKEFAHDYFTDGAHRYYGGSIGSVFKSLEDDKFKHPFEFAAKQFNGTGSFGNGGGMRAAPLAIYSLKLPDTDFEVRTDLVLFVVCSFFKLDNSTANISSSVQTWCPRSALMAGNFNFKNIVCFAL